MEKLSENQTPNLVEMRKTLVGLGNAFVQAGLADGINYREWKTIGSVSFSCGNFMYDIPSDGTYDDVAYQNFVKSMKDYMRERIADYEERILELECSKAVMEIYLSENNR